MIKITIYNLSEVYLHPDSIAYLTEAGTSSQWYGIKTLVTCFDGKVFESRDSIQSISKQIEASGK